MFHHYKVSWDTDGPLHKFPLIHPNFCRDYAVFAPFLIIKFISTHYHKGLLRRIATAALDHELWSHQRFFRVGRERESPNGCEALIHGNCRDSWPDKAPNKAPICSHHCPPLRHNPASMAHGFLGIRSETHVQYELAAAVSSVGISGHFPE